MVSPSVYLQMPRYYKKKNDRPPPTEVSAMTGIKKSKLHDYLRKLRASPGQSLKELAHGNQVLSKQQENELVQYIIQTQKDFLLLQND